MAEDDKVVKKAAAKKAVAKKAPAKKAPAKKAAAKKAVAKKAVAKKAAVIKAAPVESAAVVAEVSSAEVSSAAESAAPAPKKAAPAAAAAKVEKSVPTVNYLSLTLVRSKHGRLKSHKACVAGLGLRRMHQTVRVIDTPENRGMINKVQYLLKVEEA